MVVIRILVSVKPEQRNAFVQQLERESVALRKRKGCQRYQLFEDVTSENHFLLYEEWRDKESFDAYKQSEGFGENGKKLRPMMAGSPESLYLEGSSFE